MEKDSDADPKEPIDMSMVTATRQGQTREDGRIWTAKDRCQSYDANCVYTLHYTCKYKWVLKDASPEFTDICQDPKTKQVFS